MAIVQKIAPFLWFDTEAEEAARHYISIFPNSRVTKILRYGPGAPRPEGSVLTVGFELAGQAFTALNGGPQFPFTEAVSFVVHCETQEEVDHYWTALTAGGREVQCGWLKDRFGLSWQVVPVALFAMLEADDKAAAARAMAAMMQMVKLDIAPLQRAFDGRA